MPGAEWGSQRHRGAGWGGGAGGLERQRQTERLTESSTLLADERPPAGSVVDNAVCVKVGIDTARDAESLPIAPRPPTPTLSTQGLVGTDALTLPMSPPVSDNIGWVVIHVYSY